MLYKYKEALYVLLIVFSVFLTSCHDDAVTLKKQIRDSDTIFFNIYQNVYSEDASLQAVFLGTCLEGPCKDSDLIIKIPRIYFHRAWRARDTRSYIEEHIKKIPREQWPSVYSISRDINLSFLLSCKEDKCFPYPEVCKEDKLKCAGRLRSLNTLYSLPDGLVEVKFDFYKGPKNKFSLMNNFVWTQNEEIETLDGGYKRFTAKSMTSSQQEDGGIYYPANESDIFHLIQCKSKRLDCDYLFYIDLEESFSEAFNGKKESRLLVKASFKNFSVFDNGFAEVNERLIKIIDEVCEFMPCR